MVNPHVLDLRVMWQLERDVFSVAHPEYHFDVVMILFGKDLDNFLSQSACRLSTFLLRISYQHLSRLNQVRSLNDS